MRNDSQHIQIERMAGWLVVSVLQTKKIVWFLPFLFSLIAEDDERLPVLIVGHLGAYGI